MPTKSWKKLPKKLQLEFFFSAAMTAQNSPELHFRSINSFIQPSLVGSLLATEKSFNLLVGLLNMISFSFQREDITNCFTPMESSDDLNWRCLFSFGTFWNLLEPFGTFWNLFWKGPLGYHSFPQESVLSEMKEIGVRNRAKTDR